MLILAGVAINMALGDNGLFHKAKEAVNAWKSAETNETEALDYLMSEWDNIIKLDSSIENGGNPSEELEKLKNENTKLQEQYNQLNNRYTVFRANVALAISNKNVETTTENTDAEIVDNIGKIGLNGFETSDVLYDSGIFNSGGTANINYVTKSYQLTESDISTYSGFVIYGVTTGGKNVSYDDLDEFTVPEDSVKFMIGSSTGDLITAHTRIAIIPKQKQVSTLSAVVRGGCRVVVYGLR